MILSAVSLWKKFNLATPLGASVWGIERTSDEYWCHVSFSGHAVDDGSVRVYGQFGRPLDEEKRPAILLLPDAGGLPDRELMQYFVEKGYAVLMLDYSGRMKTDADEVMRTVYPPSLSYANYDALGGALFDLKGENAEKSAWFEWTYVALFAIEYLKSRDDIGNIGVVGLRRGGDIAWQTMLSPDVKCGIPVNAVGWHSFLNKAKFGENTLKTKVNDELAAELKSDKQESSDLTNTLEVNHSYVAAIEAQSYAPYVKCPVLMLCALHDEGVDCDRAYDTYSRIGNGESNALVYSVDTGACIGPNALIDMDLFLEKNLKGREIYVPDTLNVTIKEDAAGVIDVKVECDKEGILEETGIFYAEADLRTRSAYRDWRRVYKTSGRAIKNNEYTYQIKPFAGATAVFVYAYAKYINGFRVMSKIVSKRRSKHDPSAVKGRMLFSGKEMDCFSVAEYHDSIGGIFLEKESALKKSVGYGDVKGAYSVGGIKTYKISSPMYVPAENALLEFDVYFHKTGTLSVSIDRADLERGGRGHERFSCNIDVTGRGKWKRIILKASDFKQEDGNALKNFSDGSALSFECENEDTEFAVTNILWL